MFLDRHGLTFQDQTTNNPTQWPDPFLVEGPNHEPGMIYPRMLPNRFDCKGAATQGESSRESGAGLHDDGASIQSKLTKPSIKAPSVSSPAETSHHKTQVIEVLNIHYPDPTLSTASLFVVTKSNGIEERLWLKYTQIEGLDGAREAVERFRPIYE